MAITRYDPWNALNDLQNEVNRLFESRLGREGNERSSIVTSDWSPAVDVKEEPDRFVITADIPGVDPNDIEVDMEGGILSIRGERESEKKESRAGFKRIERAYGSFYRRFSMPDTADPERVSAHGRNGVLEITIPKREAAQPRKIRVES